MQEFQIKWSFSSRIVAIALLHSPQALVSIGGREVGSQKAWKSPMTLTFNTSRIVWLNVVAERSISSLDIRIVLYVASYF